MAGKIVRNGPRNLHSSRVGRDPDRACEGAASALPSKRKGAALFVLAMCLAVRVPVSHAQNAFQGSGDPSLQPFIGSVSLYFDNDFLSGKDSKYTGGYGLAWTSAATRTYSEKNLNRKIANAFSFLPTVNADGYRNYVQFVVAMEVYTPADIRSPEPPPGDHPYAGVLYLDSSLLSRSRIGGHQLTLRLGLVGPATGAEHVQKWVHEITGSPIPQGWDTQLKNEPIVNLFYQYDRRLLRRAPPDRFGYDFSWCGGGGLGNYYIGANVGLMGRVGYRLPDNYGVTPLLGGEESLVGVTPPRKHFQAYAFLGAQCFGVVRWLPTDGNTFKDSRSADRDDGFLSLSTGICIGFSRVLVSLRYHGIAGLQSSESFKKKNRNDFGTILFTVFLG